MKTFSAVALLALPLGALGISITSPGTSDVWNSSGSHTITWQSVSSDPTSFTILLTNYAVYPSQDLTIVANQLTSAGTFTFDTVLPVGDDYRIRFNAIVTATNSGILAESAQFSIVAGGPESQLSVSVVGGTSTVLFGTPTASTAKATNAALDASNTAKGASATGTDASAGATGTDTAGASGTGASAASGASGTGAGASGKSTGTATGTSSGHATYGSRGFAIALGMIGVGFAAMFVVA